MPFQRPSTNFGSPDQPTLEKRQIWVLLSLEFTNDANPLSHLGSEQGGFPILGVYVTVAQPASVQDNQNYRVSFCSDVALNYSHHWSTPSKGDTVNVPLNPKNRFHKENEMSFGSDNYRRNGSHTQHREENGRYTPEISCKVQDLRASAWTMTVSRIRQNPTFGVDEKWLK